MKMKMLSLLGLLAIAGSMIAMEAPTDNAIVWCVSNKFAGTQPTLNTEGQSFAAKIGSANYTCKEFSLQGKGSEDMKITYEPGDAAVLTISQKKFGRLGTFQFPMLKRHFVRKTTKKGRAYMQGYRKFVPHFTEEDGFVTFRVDLSGGSH